MSGPTRAWRLPATEVAAVLVLAALWCALWGHVDVISVVTGLVLAVAVRAVFRLPDLPYASRVSPLPLVALGARLLADIVVASVQVAWLAVRPAAPPPSGVIAVTLATRTDVVVLTCAELTSLVPGSLVVEVDRDHGTLYLHVVDLSRPDAAERVRRRTRELESRIVAAVGSSRDRRRLARADEATETDGATS